MIPKELQDKLDKFDKEFESYADQKRRELVEKFEKFDFICKRIDKDFETRENVTFDKELWEYFKNWFKQFDQSVIDLMKRDSEKCDICFLWQEEHKVV